MVEERRLDLKLGFACNNRCVFCAQGERRSECAARPMETLLEELVAARPKATGLVLTGGEPTVNKNIRMLVRAARRLGYRHVQIQTNGRALSNVRLLRALVAAGLTEVAPSLHGADAAMHDSLTRAPGSFDQTTRGIVAALRAGLPVITNSVITKQNASTLPEIVTLLADLGVQKAQLAFVHPVGTASAEFDHVVPRLPDVVAPIRAAREVARARGMSLVTEAVPLCFLRGMEDLAVEAHIPKTIVADLDRRIDHSEWRVHEGKAHGEPCLTCAARVRCEGPWREYPEHLGWDEFSPLVAAE
jgi:MoaA/NifB/PqqE/SkfB family radical SAM enzyme